jgi:dTDP-4-amino-4,6-dideoxygalactose transaminase
MEDADLAAVEAVLRSGALSAGPRVEAFEAAFAEHLPFLVRCNIVFPTL